MYDMEQEDGDFRGHTEGITDLSEDKWRSWAARETHLRALLGHYILDGQLSAYTGGPTCQRHTSHTLPMPCDNSVYEAQDLTTWRTRMIASKSIPQSFSSLFCSIFSDRVHVRHLGTAASMLTASVLLEGLTALSAERVSHGVVTIGVPSDQDISRALGRLYTFITQSTALSSVDKEVLLLRWHTICLHKAVDLNLLCRALCGKHQVEQRILGGRRAVVFDTVSWISSTRARLGLLHACSIYQILQMLPPMQSQSIHTPIALFSAGIMYCAFLENGVTILDVPYIENWDSVVLIDLDNPKESASGDLDDEVRQYLDGTFRKQQKSRNILYDFSFFSRTLKNLEHLWGVSSHMHQVLECISTQSS